MSVLTKEQIAAEIARDLPDGASVNLGIGMPILVLAAVDPAREMVFHSENGILGMSQAPEPGEEDLDLIDAGKAPVTLVAGGSFISHVDSFAIIRGGHLDYSIMGALQVSAGGDLANWWNGEGVPGVGGAMDLAAGARHVWAVMRHVSPDGAPKLVEACTYPVTAHGVVGRVYTEYGIFAPAEGGVIDVHALATGVTFEEVEAITGAPLRVAASSVGLPRA
jgi:3-oxoadipate CoA-transferase beta subunit